MVMLQIRKKLYVEWYDDKSVYLFVKYIELIYVNIFYIERLFP